MNQSVQSVKIALITEHMSAVMGYAIVKAALHSADSQSYPLPSEPSLEGRIHTALQKLPEDRRTRTVDEITTRAAAGESDRIGRFTGVDLTSAETVQSQVLALWSDEDRARLRERSGDLTEGRSRDMSGGTVNYTEMALKLHEVRCNASTSEIDRDEIALGGTIVAPGGSVMDIGTMELGKFKTGDIVSYAPRQLAVIPLQELGAEQTCSITVLFAELDGGTEFTEFVHEVLVAIEDEVDDALRTLGALIGAAIGGPIGMLGGLVLAEIAIRVYDLLIALFSNEDEIFEPETITVECSRSSGIGGQPTTGEKKLRFTEHGEYVVTYEVQAR